MLKLRRLSRLSRLLNSSIDPTHTTLETYKKPTVNSNITLMPDIRRTIHLTTTLHKKKYNNKFSNHDSDSDENDSDFKDERDSKVVKTKVNSLRADLLLKAGLGMARNKIETIFYDSKIRVNGKKLNKKSLQLNVGDEIDVIRGFSQANPAHIVVARVVILDAEEREENLSVTLRRYKTLLIENYAGQNSFKSSALSEH